MAEKKLQPERYQVTSLLGTTEALALHYSRVGTPEALALFQVIQAYYPPGKNPNNREPIDPIKVLKGLKKFRFSVRRSGAKPDMVEFS